MTGGGYDLVEGCPWTWNDPTCFPCHHLCMIPGDLDQGDGDDEGDDDVEVALLPYRSGKTCCAPNCNGDSHGMEEDHDSMACPRHVSPTTMNG